MAKHNIKDSAGHDRKFLDWLRNQPCAVTGWNFKPCDPCHIFKSFFGGGIGLKSSKAVPLWHDEHLKQHRMPEAEYWKQTVIESPMLLMRLRALYRDREPEKYAKLEQERGTMPIVLYWMDLVKEDIFLKRLIGFMADDYMRRYEIEIQSKRR